MLEGPPWAVALLLLIESATLYALLTEKWPFGVYAHTRRSGGSLWLSGMLRMVWASCGGKSSLIKPILHCFVSWSIKELTHKSVGRAGGWEVMRKVELVGSHLSVQTKIDVRFQPASGFLVRQFFGQP